ncbi:transcriptional regulator NrdR [Candidatus Micrarchaeota archaeon CG08_land_8_20_14_0_20_49_17]|nr:MAG: transcriptional regulator NrdR [Candidatus Micrarchaeota archaeon CG08_land_8_20_14_0_20_49_17]PIU81112.1 MAG: transcriptional regulator NrdR [Candidatus Micrarchaeota archaeon CG06_land_8_20_14_3_00_50_6]PIZ97054.1 MAG: transcriptional regulator NrdR [Candidatus Micrarchaeota archaeon CG_4_10_14_0_2_um_filter_49_7]HII53484.1 transcriptional repressor NrdR [Candidatus Micrarchaeota archaeon]
MQCPFCRNDDTKVMETRETESITRRRRECGKCGQRFTTYERLEPPNISVVKRDGRLERYERRKLLDGIKHACEKRPIQADALDKLVDDVEQELRRSRKDTISSKEIGKFVVRRLKEIDEIAYIRFASVYLNFSDLHKFRDEIEKMIERSEAEKEKKQEAKAGA